MDHAKKKKRKEMEDHPNPESDSHATSNEQNNIDKTRLAEDNQSDSLRFG